MKHGIRILALFSVLCVFCLSALSGCSDKTIGSIKGDSIVINSITYLHDAFLEPADCDKDERLGRVTDGKNLSYTVYSVKGREDTLLCETRSDAMVFVRQEKSVWKDPEINTLSFDGKEMDYLRFGMRGADILAVLPPLLPRNTMSYADQLTAAFESLAKTYDIIIFDRIKAFPTGYTADAMANDTLKALHLLEIKACDLMGIAEGGLIAQSMSVKYPGMFSSLILCSTAPSIGPDTRTVYAEWRSLAEQRNIPGMLDSYFFYTHSASWYEQNRDAFLAQAESVTDQDCINFIISIDGCAEYNIYDSLGSIRCPVFVLGAGDDKVFGVQGSHELMEKFRCKGFIYEGYGHGVYTEAPDYLSKVEQFMKEVRGPVE